MTHLLFRPERVSGNGKQLCQCQCHPDFSWMKFGDTNIHPTDADCLFVVERKGYFLWIEWKEMDEELTAGQKILMERLSCIPEFRCLILRGTGGEPKKLQNVVKSHWYPEEPIDRISFQDRLDSWFLRANSR